MSLISFHIREHGVTLLEVIAVLVIVAVIAAAVVNRHVSTASYTLAAETNTLKTHLRYAQFRALSDDVTWGMSFTENSYTLLRNGSTSPYHLPNDASATHTLPVGIIMSPVPVTVAFDGWGSPGAAAIQITLQAGSESQSFAITRNTGFIP